MAQKKKSKKPGNNKISIFIVDDHPIVQQGLTELLNHEDDIFHRINDYDDLRPVFRRYIRRLPKAAERKYIEQRRQIRVIE